MTVLQRATYSAWFTLAGVTSAAGQALAAQTGEFGGPIPAIPGTPGAASEGDIRGIILRALVFVLNFLALIAVIIIVIAGIRLIVSQGEEEEKNKAKKTILYVVIGLLIVLFARVIVGFFTDTVSQTF
jgi:type IV secretory pathway VirB2 component (pilin)